MRVLMLGNSFTSTNNMPQTLAELTGAEMVHHTRGGARLSEQLNPKARLGVRTQAALLDAHWAYVVLREMSNGPVTSPKSFFGSVQRLCEAIRQNGAVPILYATWTYQKGRAKLVAMGMEYEEMLRRMHEAYHQAAVENHALIADVGQRFYELSAAEDLYAADGVHLNELDSRIAAETIAAIEKHKKEMEREAN